MSEQDAGAETIISDEELELATELEDTEDVEALKAQIEKDKIAKAQILARAKKAEAENKELKKPKEALATQHTTNALTAEDVEVKILKAQKIPDDEILYLKKLAVLNGTSIIEAQSDDIYLTFKSNKEAVEKAEKARLGVSKGSGSIKKEKGLNTPELSAEEHKELWKRQNEQ